MIFADLLRPLTVDQFLLNYFGKRPLCLHGVPGRFAVLEPDDAAARLARTGLERDFERVLDTRVEVAFGPPPLNEKPVRVPRDSMLLILKGSARTYLWDQAMTEPTDAPAIHEMAAGDWLYVPRNWWLAGQAADVRAMCVAVINPTGHDLMAWLMGKLRTNEFLARDLPRYASLTEQADYLTDIRRTIVRMCRTPGLLLLYSGFASGAAPPRPACVLPMTSGRTIDFLARHDLRLWRNNAETITFRFAGKDLMFPVEAAGMLVFLEEHAPVSAEAFFAAFAGQFDRDELEHFLEVLEREGLAQMIGSGVLDE